MKYEVDKKHILFSRCNMFVHGLYVLLPCFPLIVLCTSTTNSVATWICRRTRLLPRDFIYAPAYFCSRQVQIEPTKHVLLCSRVYSVGLSGCTDSMCSIHRIEQYIFNENRLGPGTERSLKHHDLAVQSDRVR